MFKCCKYNFRFSWFCFLICASFLFFQCAVQEKYANGAYLAPTSSAFSEVDVCSESANYIPDPKHLDHFPIKTTLLNFHVIQNAAKDNNFTESDGIDFMYDVIDRANTRLQHNQHMHLDSSLPVLPIGWQFEMDKTGVSFQSDPASEFVFYGRQRNLNDRSVYDKYAMEKEKVLNVFVMANPASNLESKKPKINGLALDGWMKVRGWHFASTDTTFREDGTFELEKIKLAVGDLIHEAAHIHKLYHTWRSNDYCDDTPKHQNCWAWTPDWKICSNNVMDYNTWRTAWTPCQIGRLQKAFYKYPNTRKLLKKDWCVYDSTKTIDIKGDIEWNACKDFTGDIIIHNQAKLTIRCAVSMAKGSKIIIEPKGTLVLDGARLYNDCGDTWKGIITQSNKRSTGEILYQKKPIIEHVTNTLELLPSKNTDL